MAALVQTLLTMTQDILSDIDGEEINSISDTVEAEQIAQIIIDTYFDLVSMRMLPEHKELIQLEALSDSTRPNYLKMPSNVTRLFNDEFFYDKSDSGDPLSYGRVCWLEPWDFLERSHRLNPDNATTTAVLDINAGSTIYISNDQHPSFFTSFDDVHLVCNSYDSDIDSTLQNSKTQAWAIIIPSLSKSDAATPDIDPDYFPYLKSEARARAFAWSDRQVDQKAEQIARRNKVDVQNRLLRIGKDDRKRKYGRT